MFYNGEYLNIKNLKKRNLWNSSVIELVRLSIFNQINTDLRDYDSVNNFGGYVSGTKVNDAVVLFKRIDKE